MIKILIILLLLLFLVAMIATRYRRQIMMGIQVFQMFRKMRAVNMPQQEKQIHKKDEGAAVPLVKCVKCGTWVPRSNAMKLGGNTYYCSAVCVEKSEIRV
jgi:hypothetical protein